MSFLAQSIAVSIMCVESMECTKLGGKAEFCLDLLTGWSSRESLMVRLYKIVVITFLFLIDL